MRFTSGVKVMTRMSHRLPLSGRPLCLPRTLPPTALVQPTRRATSLPEEGRACYRAPPWRRAEATQEPGGTPQL